jgi:hypothetical protein
MVLHPLHISGPEEERVSLTFFADGCERTFTLEAASFLLPSED